jgi:hypothetical protein
MKKRRLPLLLAAAALPLPLHAELLVYEGFDPSDPGMSLDSGQLAGASNKGFAADSAWQAVGTKDFSTRYLDDGLTMEGLASIGGAVQIGVGPSAESYANVFRKSGVTVAPGADFYGSFLFQTAPAPSRFVTFLGVESGEDLPGRSGAMAGPHLVGDVAAAVLFAVSPDSFARDEEIGPNRITQSIKVARSKEFQGKDEAGAEYEMMAGETYLVVWRVVGAAEVDVNAASQEVVMWILNKDNLSSIRAAGQIDDAAVDGNNIVRIVVNKSTRARLVDTDFLTIGAGMAGIKGTGESIYDELRIGTDMASVLPAP